MQELAARIPQLHEALTQQLCRQPDECGIAESAGVRVSEVVEAQRAQDAYRPQSLDEIYHNRTLAEGVGATDGDIDALVEFSPLHDAIDRLEERQRFIVRRRYFDHWSQTRVAGILGISQMQVSRLERAGLRKLRTDLGAGAGGQLPAN